MRTSPTKKLAALVARNAEIERLLVTKHGFRPGEAFASLSNVGSLVDDHLARGLPAAATADSIAHFENEESVIPRQPRSGDRARTHGNSAAKTRYWYSIWGKRPGWGYEAGWCFGATPEAAVADALKDARKFGPPKFALPAAVHLKPERYAPGVTDMGDQLAFNVAKDGSMVEDRRHLEPVEPRRHGNSRRTPEALEQKAAHARLKARIGALRIGEKLDLPPNAYVKKHQAGEYSLNDRDNHHRNRWGTLPEITGDAAFYLENRTLPPPVGERW